MIIMILCSCRLARETKYLLHRSTLVLFFQKTKAGRPSRKAKSSPQVDAGSDSDESAKQPRKENVMFITQIIQQPEALGIFRGLFLMDKFCCFFGLRLIFYVSRVLRYKFLKNLSLLCFTLVFALSFERQVFF